MARTMPVKIYCLFRSPLKRGGKNAFNSSVVQKMRIYGKREMSVSFLLVHMEDKDIILFPPFMSSEKEEDIIALLGILSLFL